MIDISVVTVAGTYSYKNTWMEECIESVLSQVSPATDFIITDNKNALKERDDVVVINDTSYENKAKSYNDAIGTTVGNWILILNPNDRLGQHCIEWLKIKIKQLQDTTGDEQFLLRFPVRIGKTEEYIVSAICFHKHIWETLNGFFDEAQPENQFVSAVLRNKHFKVYDANWKGIVGDPLEYCTHNVYPVPATKPVPSPATVAMPTPAAPQYDETKVLRLAKDVSISVITPVGPWEHNLRWLDECIDSVRQQSVPAFEHILVDDSNKVRLKENKYKNNKIVSLGQHVGMANAINYGIREATTDWVATLGSDDMFGPRCIEWLAYKIGYIYSTGYRKPFFLRYPIYIPVKNEVIRNGQCFHKEVWKAVGGYPQAGALDVLFISAILSSSYSVWDSDWPFEVGDPKQYIIMREHDDQWSKQKAEWKTKWSQLN